MCKFEQSCLYDTFSGLSVLTFFESRTRGDDITVNQVEEYSGVPESYQFIFIDATTPKWSTLKVCALYRPPRRSLSNSF